MSNLSPALSAAIAVVREEQRNPFVTDDSVYARVKKLFSWENPIEDFPIDGRQLHRFLKVKTDYRHWSERVISDADMVQGQDFNPVNFVRVAQEGNRTVNREEKNHKFTLSAAKEIAMLQKSNLGKLVRQYLIWAEEQLRKQVPTVDNLVNRPDLLIALATRIKEQNQRIEEQQEQIETMAPMAEVGEAVSSSPGSISMRDLALLITQNGYEIGQNRLFNWMVDNHYLYRVNGQYRPLQEYQERGIFNVQTRDVQTGDYRSLKSTVKITGRGVEYFLNIFRRIVNHGETNHGETEETQHGSSGRCLQLVEGSRRA